MNPLLIPILRDHAVADRLQYSVMTCPKAP